MIHALRHWLVHISLLKIPHYVCVEGRKRIGRLTKGFSSFTCFSGQYLLPQPENLIRGLVLEGSQSPDCKHSLSRLLLDAWTELRFPWDLTRILTNSSFPCWRKINRNHLITHPPWGNRCEVGPLMACGPERRTDGEISGHVLRCLPMISSQHLERALWVLSD